MNLPCLQYVLPSVEYFPHLNALDIHVSPSTPKPLGLRPMIINPPHLNLYPKFCIFLQNMCLIAVTKQISPACGDLVSSRMATLHRRDDFPHRIAYLLAKPKITGLCV